MGFDGLDWVGQTDFSAGAFPLQERIPASAVEDCVNGLFDDDGSIFKRGGGAYKSAAAAAALTAVWDAVLAGGQRTFMLDTSGRLNVVGADDSSVAQVYTQYALAPQRVTILAGLMAIPFAAGVGLANTMLLTGGSRRGPGGGGALVTYGTGTVSLTKGSRVVTGVGTSWVANADAGSILVMIDGIAGIASVDSNTQMTLLLPWVGATASNTSYAVASGYFAQFSPINIAASGRTFGAVAGNRLIAGNGQTVAFGPILNPMGSPAANDTNYHVTPDPGSIIGLEGLGDALLVFTTAGVYRIGNMSYDLTDASGNVQQSLSTVARDVTLWDGRGIVSVDGGVLIPAIDDLYVYGGGQLQRFHAPGMRKQYRQYVKAGYTLGNAAVHRGHYFLPILDSAGTTLEDVLVLRLDSGAWSRWSGHSAGVSFAQRGATSTAAPKLLAAKSTRVLDLTGCFEPAAATKNDADASTPQWQVTLRTVQRRTPKEKLRKVRVRAELDDAASDDPTITAEVAVGRPGSSFTALSGSMAENVGQSPKTWTNVNQQGSEFRVRLTSVGASAKLVLRSVEYAFRPSGRQ